ncbi:YceI family protein [Cohaesibacter intestini]|uniref:YceI family protein n=1 Tax=Cohaesibacter intestini TaxID=2211145 RepID=UPI000DEAD2A9|nr:YceI family protein [Cohaesibacter intestini]
MFIKNLRAFAVVGGLGLAAAVASPALAADYVIDTQGAHASIAFSASHLGISYTTGRFNTFSGDFSYDKDAPAASKVAVEIETDSVDTNHAERDKHLRTADFLEVSKYPTASFVSTGIELTGDKTAKITGDFTLRGVTKPVVIDAEFVGEGKDPWGGYRAGFKGTTSIALKDYGFKMDFGTIDLTLNVEGVRK